MGDQNNERTVKDKKKPKGERRRASEQAIEEGKLDPELPPEPSSDEIKKFKENLLKSVATADPSASQSKILQPNDDVFGKPRSRSASRAHQLITRQDLLNNIDEEKLFELKEAFLLFDLNGDGYIDHNDLRGTLISLGEAVDDSAVRSMLSEASNPLDFDAFVTLLGYKTLELDSEETLVAALSRWDRDNSGYIPEERIRRDLMTQGDKFTKKETDYALDEAPTEERGGKTMIDYVRFCSKLCGLRRTRNNEEATAF